MVEDALSPVIDEPNTASLARKVRLRDGGCCANCKRKLGLQAHHIRFRSKGGRTVLANECCVCVACHSLIHQGLLKVTGNPIDGITFHTKAGELTEEFTRELQEEISAVPVLIISPPKDDDPGPSGPPEPTGSPELEAAPEQGHQEAPAEDQEAGRPAKDRDSGRPVEGARRPAEEHEAVKMTEGALRTLGFPPREARERAQRARESLLKGGRSSLAVADCSDLLREAFRSRQAPRPDGRT